MDINALNAEIEKQSAAANAAYSALMSHIDNTLTKWVNKSGIEGAFYRQGSHSHAEIGVKTTDENGKTHWHDFDLYFDEEWPEHTYSLKVNFGCFGSFAKEDVLCVRYCALLGFFTANLAEIENELLFTPEAKALFKANNEISRALWKLADQKRAYEADIKRAEDEARRKAIEAKLVVGAELRVGFTWDKKPVYDEIERVTNKLIFLKKNYGSSTKKEKAIQMISDKRWEFVD